MRNKEYEKGISFRPKPLKLPELINEGFFLAIAIRYRETDLGEQTSLSAGGCYLAVEPIFPVECFRKLMSVVSSCVAFTRKEGKSYIP